MTATITRIQGNNVNAGACSNTPGAASKELSSLTQSQDIPYGYCHCGCGEKTLVAPRNSTQFGWVKGEPLRYLHRHKGTPFDAKWVEDDRGFGSPCHTWQGSLCAKGYGRVNRGRHGVSAAHRFAYIREHGPIPDGLEIDHLCRNRACVNPAHLEPVTRTENSRRAGTTRLTMEDAEEIRRLMMDAPRSKSGLRVRRGTREKIAAQFGITANFVTDIVNDRAWRHD